MTRRHGETGATGCLLAVKPLIRQMLRRNLIQERCMPGNYPTEIYKPRSCRPVIKSIKEKTHTSLYAC